MKLSTFSRLLIAVVAAAALAVTASPGSHAAASARFSLTIDGTEIATFSGFAVSEGSVVLDWVKGTPALRTWVLTQKRADPDVVMYSTDGKPVARYHLEDAWPAKVEIGALKAGASEVLMESLTLAHEGFKIQ